MYSVYVSRYLYIVYWHNILRKFRQNFADKLEVKSESDMVNGIDMRISNISLIIYCAYRYIFMGIWRIWGENALSITVDASIRSRLLEDRIRIYF